MSECELPASVDLVCTQSLQHLADLRCVVQQFHGVKVILVFDEIIPEAAVGEVLHDQPQVPPTCHQKRGQWSPHRSGTETETSDVVHLPAL